MTDAIENWRGATEEVADAFVKKYFPDNPRYDFDDGGTPNSNIYWVGGEVGSVFYISKMFFDVDRMIEALELNATFDQLYDYYHTAVEHGRDDPGKEEVRDFVEAMEKMKTWLSATSLINAPEDEIALKVFSKTIDTKTYQALKAWLAKPGSDKPMLVNFKDYVKYGWIKHDGTK